MSMPILTTKLYIPLPRSKLVKRSHLIQQLNEGINRKLTLISAPAGFGKTTLVSEWVADCKRPAAWLTLDDGENDVIRFLSYLIASLQTIDVNIGKQLLGMMQSVQLPSTEWVLTNLLNDISAAPDHFILVLDDYHVINSDPVNEALAFMLEYMPLQMHLAIITREDPDLPLARFRAGSQLTELKSADLRFTMAEATAFLNQMMDLNLTEDDISMLETRTEGWVAGLQLAGLSAQGHKDDTGFIKSFTGWHHFIGDYLLEEVLKHQPAEIRKFLLCTSILDCMCGSLCDIVAGSHDASGQETLEKLVHTNLFIIPLDNERHWYRYHQLFTDLLQHQLYLQDKQVKETGVSSITELHARASLWYEENGFELEAFKHAVKANNIDNVVRLLQGHGVPLYYRGAMTLVLHWLESLPTIKLNCYPSLWVTYAIVLIFSGKIEGVEKKLKAAEEAMPSMGTGKQTRDIAGQIAAVRALLAATQNQVNTVIGQTRIAMEFISPDNLPVYAATKLAMGSAYKLQGDYTSARSTFTEVMSVSHASGNTVLTIGAAVSLGSIQESENQLHLAAETYQHILQMIGDPGHMTACTALLGLARINYEWNHLDLAEKYGRLSLDSSRDLECQIPISCRVFLAHLKLARGDIAGAHVLLDEASQYALDRKLLHHMPEIVAEKVLILLHQGDLKLSAQLAETYKLPISKAQVLLTRGDTAAASKLLETVRRDAENKQCDDIRLKVMILQALTMYAQGEKVNAVRMICDALSLAEPGGFIRSFTDAGIPMAILLSKAVSMGIMSKYLSMLLEVFEKEKQKNQTSFYLPSNSLQTLNEPLSGRELEVLKLIAQGLSNYEICEKLCLALDTVKGHNRRIFGKLQVKNRTDAVDRAIELGLL